MGKTKSHAFARQITASISIKSLKSTRGRNAYGAFYVSEPLEDLNGNKIILQRALDGMFSVLYGWYYMCTSQEGESWAMKAI